MSLSKNRSSITNLGTQEDVESLDPLTFSQRGDFLRQLAYKLHNFLGNSPEENLILTSILSRMFSQPAHLRGEYVIDQIEERLTLLHIFLFEIPTQFSNSQPQSLYHHWHFLT